MLYTKIMKIDLPPAFVEEMKDLLKEDFSLLQACYENEAYCGLRLNPLKISKKDFLAKQKFSLQPIPWCSTAFYYQKGEIVSKHPWHHGGFYYIQEPSATKVVEAMKIETDDLVLDLCAAPGGKASQIAGKLENGLLIANEINYSRATVLAGNLERLAVASAVVTNETPERLISSFTAYFDKILVDAPCSGSGMFRKDPTTIKQWQASSPQSCATRQRHILSTAQALLKKGGLLAYSTCSFSFEENAAISQWFLSNHPEFSLLKEERMWPFQIAGEGGYYALFKKAGFADKRENKVFKRKKELENTVRSWLALNEIEFPTSLVHPWGQQINMIAENFPSVKGLKILRFGLPLGNVRNLNFVPHHSLALALKPNLPLDEKAAYSYLNGESFKISKDDGWYVVGFEDCSLGWAKLSQGILKNHYPKGLRFKINI